MILVLFSYSFVKYLVMWMLKHFRIKRLKPFCIHIAGELLSKWLVKHHMVKILCMIWAAFEANFASNYRHVAGWYCTKVSCFNTLPVSTWDINVLMQLGSWSRELAVLTSPQTPDCRKLIPLCSIKINGWQCAQNYLAATEFESTRFARIKPTL